MDFSNIIGNAEIKEYLEKNVMQRNILHSYLFLGTEGIGKLLIAKEFAKGILCLNHTEEKICTCKSCTCFNGKNHPDFDCINEEGETIKIDTVRKMIEKTLEKPILSEKKVYIINDFDKMTQDAQNCLLKTLEEPPEFVVIILISSNENAVLNTIKSRCMKIKFHNIGNNELLEYAKNNLGYDYVSDNLLKAFGGSIKRAIKLKENKEIYEQIDSFISNLEKKDLVDIMLDGRMLYDKEKILDYLDYIMVCLYSKKDENYAYLDCIKYVDECINRLKSNSNFDMSVDNLLLKMWEEVNESSYRS